MNTKSSLKKINSLWIETSPRWGGPEQVAMSDITEMVNAEIPVSLICIEGSPIHAAAARVAKVKVFPVPAKKGSSDRSLARYVGSVLAEVNPNILHIDDESLVWDLMRDLWKRPELSVIANRHTPVEYRIISNYLASFSLRRLDYMLVLSESVKRSVLSQYAIPEKKVKVINLGLDFLKFDPEKVSGKAMRAHWSADKDTVVIGTVGRLVPEMGQETFVKSAAGLLKNSERKLRFVIVGEEPLVAADEYVGELRKLVDLFHIEEHVTFAALSDNLPEVMAALDILVMPGREEVPGLGALEALAMERPTVLSKVAGAEEIVGNGNYGVLVKPEDAFDLQQAIQYLLENPSQRLSMGSKGRQHVLKHYDKRIRTSRLFDIYEKCLKRRFAQSVKKTRRNESS